jgi:hypothetical protein
VTPNKSDLRQLALRGLSLLFVVLASLFAAFSCFLLLVAVIWPADEPKIALRLAVFFVALFGLIPALGLLVMRRVRKSDARIHDELTGGLPGPVYQESAMWSWQRMRYTMKRIAAHGELPSDVRRSASRLLGYMKVVAIGLTVCVAWLGLERAVA